MSKENVETFKRVAAAGTSFDVEAMLADLDPEVEWHPALPALIGGAGTVYRGHEGVRELMRDFEEAFAEDEMEFPDIRDLGDRVIAIGTNRNRGRSSGAQTESPIAYVVEFKNGKVMLVRTFLDPKEALKAAGIEG